MGSRTSLRPRRGLAIGLLALSLLLVAGSGAASADPTSMVLTFTSRAPSHVTGVHIDIVFRKPGDPNAKPPTLRQLVINAPAGIVVNSHAVPICTASDQELMALGRLACPPETQIGDGTLSVMTGFGPPADPATGNATIFNDGQGFVEIVQVPGTNVTVGQDRVHRDGTTLTASPKTPPGGPPDGETALREINFTLWPTTGVVSTPSICPPDHQWRSTGWFTFADGTTQFAAASTPCDPGSSSAAGKPGAKGKRGKPAKRRTRRRGRHTSRGKRGARGKHGPRVARPAR